MNQLCFSSTEKLNPCDAVAAILVTENYDYLMQLRDNKNNIFYPSHWGCFGGAIDNGETDRDALKRELYEELSLFVKDSEVKYFTQFTFDFKFANYGMIKRTYFEININTSVIDKIKLNEGSDMRVFNINALLSNEYVTPYDAYALWMYISKSRLLK